MLLLIWNLAARKSKIESQIEAVLKHNPDIIAFQEVTIGTKIYFEVNFRKQDMKILKTVLVCVSILVYSLYNTNNVVSVIKP